MVEGRNASYTESNSQNIVHGNVNASTSANLVVINTPLPTTNLTRQASVDRLDAHPQEDQQTLQHHVTTQQNRAYEDDRGNEVSTAPPPL